jgi:hypothetical protein
MWGVRNCAAAALCAAIAFAVSGCAEIEDALNPPPLETAFNPQPAPPVPGPETPAPRLTPPGPSEARAEIVDWLTKHDYRSFQVDALLEHARVESGLQACAAGPGGYHYLFQWGGTRLQQLQRFAKTSGCPQIHTQLAFADKELRNDPKFTCFWDATTESGAYAALRRGFGGGSC